MKIPNSLLLLLAVAVSGLCADPSPTSIREYVLGPDDGLSINVADLAEFDAKALGVIKVDHQGDIRLPLVGPHSRFGPDGRRPGKGNCDPVVGNHEQS